MVRPKAGLITSTGEQYKASFTRHKKGDDRDTSDISPQNLNMTLHTVPFGSNIEKNKAQKRPQG